MVKNKRYFFILALLEGNGLSKLLGFRKERSFHDSHQNTFPCSFPRALMSEKRYY